MAVKKVAQLTAVAARAKAPIGQNPSPGSAEGIVAWILYAV